MRELALEAHSSAMDLVLHLHPAPDAPAPPFERLAGLDATARRHPSLTVYTKGDLIGAERRAELEPEWPRRVGHDRRWGSIGCSPGSREHLPEGEFEFDPEDVGTQPVRFFVVRVPAGGGLRAARGRAARTRFTAEVEEFREAERPVYIRVTLFVERESQKRIVIGAGGRDDQGDRRPRPRAAWKS